MKPIAQTFYINEDPTSIPGVYITKVDVYFQSVSTAFGVRLQIRTTDNGNPSLYNLPFADKIILPTDVYPNGSRWTTNNALIPSSTNILQADPKAITPTTFEFDTPQFVQSGQSYAIVVIPEGNNPDYAIWTSEINGIDVSTNSPVKTNNDTGILFLSSNDIQYTGYQTEDMKFAIYVANFVDDMGVPISSANAVFTSIHEEQAVIKEVKGSFISNEQVYMSDAQLRLAKLTFSSNTGIFLSGERIYQSNGSANIAAGFVKSMNTSSIQVYDTLGVFSSSYQVKGITSNANAVVSAVSQSVLTTAGSNTISVPYVNTTQIAAGMMLYFSAPAREGNTDLGIVTGVSTVTGTITVSQNLSFTSSNAGMGRIRGDGYLKGGYSGPTSNYVNPNRIPIMIDNSTANATVNFANSIGRILIGGKSKASANIMIFQDRFYDSVLPQIAQTSPNDTSIDWYFYGANNDANRTLDTIGTPITPYVEKFFDDKERTVMSRSNEYSNLPAPRSGNSSVFITANLSTTNTYVSPSVDSGTLYATYTSNYLVPEDYLKGYFINIPKYDNFNIMTGNVVFQVNSTGSNTGVGTVIGSNATHIFVAQVNGYFSNNSTVILYTTEGDKTSNTAPYGIQYYSEHRDINYTASSRYISKSVTLAPGQEAEDIRCFLTAYRPNDTDLIVYSKVQNKNDVDTYFSKSWSRLLDLSSGALKSSTSNKNDYVELEYGFPVSQELFANSCNGLNAVTFNGTSAVSVYDNTISIPFANTKFSVNDRVLYRSVTGSVITPFSNNSYYYVSAANTSTLKLSLTQGGANIDITVVGSSDTGHSLVGDYTMTMVLPSTSGLNQGDMIYINDNIKSQFNIRRVEAIVDTTTVVLQQNTSFSSTNCSIGVIPGMDNRDGTFVYSKNNNICRYVTLNDVIFDGYSTFSIKIVPVSNTTYTVPRVADFRAIALQV
jgi:hypothetical protein